MKYRKKPVIVEAVKSFGDTSINEGPTPEWLQIAYENGVIYRDSANGRDMYIKTLEGPMLVNHGDYIIQGVQGELYPCKPDIFEQTYTKVIE